MARTPDYIYILMKDVHGEKAPAKFAGFALSSPKPVQVLRGELLVPISPRERVPRNDGRPPHNYHSWREPNVTLYSVEDDVSPMAARSTDLQLLQAIRRSFDCFAVFSANNKLEWGGSLRKGDQVYVKLPSDNESSPTWSIGVVEHIGPVEGLPGRNFGVEIKVSTTLWSCF